MSLEEDIFQRYLVKKTKLKEYGFKLKQNRLTFEKKLTKDDLKTVIEYDGKFIGKIYDLNTGDEYTNFRIESSNGFSAEIREEFINLLTNIRDKCSEKQLFQSEQTQKACQYITEKYNDEPEFLWKNFPSYAVFRNKKNNKWYALFGAIQRNKVDTNSSSTEIVEIINLKVNKDKINEILVQNGVYEAYHMNKKNWISLIMDKTLTDSEIQNFIDNSYQNI